MKTPAFFAFLLSLGAVAQAWTFPQKANAVESTTTSSGRREFFGAIAAASASLALTSPAHATAAKTGSASPFTGDYDDPNHPGCLRQVKVVGAPMRGDGTRSAFPVIEVVGYDGNSESSNMCTEQPASREDLWKVSGTVKSTNNAVIDFSPKGGPAGLSAVYQEGGIVFPDGNKWTKIAPGTADLSLRRPKDMSTLKSAM